MRAIVLTTTLLSGPWLAAWTVICLATIVWAVRPSKRVVRIGLALVCAFGLAAGFAWADDTPSYLICDPVLFWWMGYWGICWPW